MRRILLSEIPAELTEGIRKRCRDCKQSGGDLSGKVIRLYRGEWAQFLWYTQLEKQFSHDDCSRLGVACFPVKNPKK